MKQQDSEEIARTVLFLMLNALFAMMIAKDPQLLLHEKWQLTLLFYLASFMYVVCWIPGAAGIIAASIKRIWQIMFVLLVLSVVMVFIAIVVAAVIALAKIAHT